MPIQDCTSPPVREPHARTPQTPPAKRDPIRQPGEPIDRSDPAQQSHGRTAPSCTFGYLTFADAAAGEMQT
jgi:hypothetical protein